MKYDASKIADYDLSSLRILASVGESVSQSDSKSQ